MLSDIINQVLRQKGAIDNGISEAISEVVSPLIESTIANEIQLSHTTTQILCALIGSSDIEVRTNHDSIHIAIGLAEQLHIALHERRTHASQSKKLDS